MTMARKNCSEEFRRQAVDLYDFGSLGRGVWLGQEDDRRRHHYCQQPFRAVAGGAGQAHHQREILRQATKSFARGDALVNRFQFVADLSTTSRPPPVPGNVLAAA
jgi:hypothetical protein